MHRFFVPSGTLHSNASVSLNDYAHQLHDVLRLRPGDPITLLDGNGMEYDATLTDVAPRCAAARVGEGRPCRSEPRLQLTLYACTLKADKFEWVLQKGTELGVSRFVPVVSRRSVVRPASSLVGKIPRWQSIVREAAEQSRRARLPDFAPPVDYAAAIAQSRTHPDLRLIAWEDADASPLVDIPALVHAAQDSRRGVSLLVGPEGGFDADEVSLAQEAGWQIVSMGNRILRAETASLAGVAILLALAGDMGTFSRAR